MIPIEVAILKVIEHGDDVHKLQQPEPSTLVHVTDRVSLRLVIGLSSIVVVVDDVDGDDWSILAASSNVLNDDVLNDVGVLNDDVLNDVGVLNDDVVCI